MDKKIVCVFLYLVILQQYIFAQDYRPLLEKGSEWHSFEQFEFGIVADKRIQLLEDTIIDNKIYYKADITSCFSSESECVDEDELSGINNIIYVREDTLERKVYQRRIFSSSSTDYLLYDFSLMPGDTFDTGYEKFVLDSITDYVDNRLDCFGQQPQFDIDSIKIFYFNDTDNPYLNIIWVEGIGSLKGLLEIDNLHSWGGGAAGPGSLLCHNKGNGENTFKYKYCGFYDNPCQLTSTINTENQLNFHVFPNPSHDRITVELPENKRDISIRVYDLQGREVVVSEESVIEVSHLPKGVYVVAVFEEGRWLGSEKVVKE